MPHSCGLGFIAHYRAGSRKFFEEVKAPLAVTNYGTEPFDAQACESFIRENLAHQEKNFKIRDTFMHKYVPKVKEVLQKGEAAASF
jgi:hypothetical protein